MVCCFKMLDVNMVIFGFRDMIFWVWDIRNGILIKLFVGYQVSVWCLEIKGDIVVFGSYDIIVKVWSIFEGCCFYMFLGYYS